jgi:hypothetical protein
VIKGRYRHHRIEIAISGLVFDQKSFYAVSVAQLRSDSFDLGARRPSCWGGAFEGSNVCSVFSQLATPQGNVRWLAEFGQRYRAFVSK